MARGKRRCAAFIWPAGAYRNRPCGNAATIERDGKWYCHRHEPERRANYAAAMQARRFNASGLGLARQREAGILAELGIAAEAYLGSDCKSAAALDRMRDAARRLREQRRRTHAMEEEVRKCLPMP